MTDDDTRYRVTVEVDHGDGFDELYAFETEPDGEFECSITAGLDEKRPQLGDAAIEKRHNGAMLYSIEYLKPADEPCPADWKRDPLKPTHDGWTFELGKVGHESSIRHGSAGEEVPGVFAVDISARPNELTTATVQVWSQKVEVELPDDRVRVDLLNPVTGEVLPAVGQDDRIVPLYVLRELAQAAGFDLHDPGEHRVDFAPKAEAKQ